MERFERDGFVVLRGELTGALVGELRDAIERVVARSDKPRMRVPFELVRRRPFDDKRLLALAIGARIRDRWIRCARPGSRAQGIHRDASFASGPATWLSIDVLLTPFTAMNGATEIWPGSHRIPDLDDAERARTEARAASRESVLITGEPGDVVVRDPRAWHRAGANQTEAVRMMLSLDCEDAGPSFVDDRHHVL